MFPHPPFPLPLLPACSSRSSPLPISTLLSYLVAAHHRDLLAAELETTDGLAVELGVEVVGAGVGELLVGIGSIETGGEERTRGGVLQRRVADGGECEVGVLEAAREGTEVGLEEAEPRLSGSGAVGTGKEEKHGGGGKVCKGNEKVKPRGDGLCTYTLQSSAFTSSPCASERERRDAAPSFTAVLASPTPMT